MTFTDLEPGDIIKIKKEKALKEWYGDEAINKKLRIKRVQCNSIGPTLFFFNHCRLHFHDDEDIFDEWFEIVEMANE